MNGVIIPTNNGGQWINITSGNGRNVRYYCDGSTVYVEMDTTDTSNASATIGTIPEGYRPNTDISVTAWFDGTNKRIYYINAATGVISAYSNMNWIAPAMVSYPKG